MCGIVAYVGSREASHVVLSGLRRLEYRGYDSAGLAVLENGVAVDGKPTLARLTIKRVEGKLDNLLKSIEKEPLPGHSAIGHTRWATHGGPSEKNAHPHRYRDVVIVHNGIIENYAEIKTALIKKGHEFQSETDSEVIAHLLQVNLDENENFEVACRKTINAFRGAFAISAVWLKRPRTLFVAKQQCPIVLGIGKNEQFVASDIPALLDFTKDFIFLEDGEMAFVEPGSVKIVTFAGKNVNRKPHRVEWSLAMAEREGYPHFMLKEIFEQPRVLIDTFRGRMDPSRNRVELDLKGISDSKLKSLKSVSLVACGTAWHSGLVGKYWIEKFSRLHAEVDLASEFRYRKPVVLPNSLFVAISQSGETADTLAALQEAIKLKMLPLAITNCVESSIARRAKNVLYTHAGPEIAVASTKCFMAQMALTCLLGVKLAIVRKSQSTKWIHQMLLDLADLPQKVEETLKLNDQIKQLAEKYSKYEQYFYLGRGFSYPIALEGALKLKEISYINTQAYPAGEMKHGPIALISDQWPVVCVAPDGENQEKMISNIKEVQARGGKIILIGTEGQKNVEDYATEFIAVPKIRDELSPFLTTVVLQLFAYHMSVLRGCDVDKPKNLAKSVTVE